MKTAEDVISRLLWDPQVPSERFSIGYLDRFLGTLEQPFTAFSWEDLASASPGVLAIPKHRIQYFKYQERVVWEKASRTDDIFGSTGSGRTILEVMEEEVAVAPGIGKGMGSFTLAAEERGVSGIKEEVHGEGLANFGSVGERQTQREQLDPEKFGEDSVSCVSVVSGSLEASMDAGEEGGRLGSARGRRNRPDTIAGELDISEHTREEAEIFCSSGEACTVLEAKDGDVATKIGSTGGQRATVDGKAPEIGSTGSTHAILPGGEATQSSKETAWEIGGDAEPPGQGLGRTTALASQEEDLQADLCRPWSPHRRQRPTHFVAVRITSPELREAVRLIQTSLCQARPDLAEFCIPLGTLHLTLCLLRLDTPEEIATAITALQELRAESQRLLPPAPFLRFSGVDCFRAHVLYAAPATAPELGALTRGLEATFRQKGLAVIHPPGGQRFHLTLAKIPPRKMAPRLPETLSWAPPTGDLGTQVVESLCLCHAGKGRRTDGFYSTLVELELY
uniref:Leukocyte receptor cluster member 9 n=1 Tax=Sphenodon punctatus TaxID=8508 RepID=A0A8D0GBL5_SPHPU